MLSLSYISFLHFSEANLLQMSVILGKLGLIHVHKVSSLISQCSQHLLITDFFRLNEVSKKSS